ncbi:MAG: cyclodeaminase/cyclohydrolase family protein [Candidatus Omnitrophota bacterium]|nr:MAG: cyclodeaminase/cyclohydrolase family protein [Candidatus Omnitrophota bacterium]
MKTYKTEFKGYLDDLAKKAPTPGGGSAVCVVFCIAVSLMEMAIQYSLGKNKKLKEHLGQLQKLKRKVYPFIDLDGKLFNQIMKSKDSSRQKLLKKSEELIVELGRACLGLLSLAKKAESGIKKSIISDFYIGLGLGKVVLAGCIFNLEANSRMFGSKNKYIKIFKKSLKSWPK